MTQCAHASAPAMFYKVLVISLTTIILIFCLIITGLFVDIDSMINSKTTAKPLRTSQSTFDPVYEKILPGFRGIKERWNDYDDFLQRSRRSIGAQDSNLIKIQKEKVNNILKNRLVNLLREMESENAKIEEDRTKVHTPDEGKEDIEDKTHYIQKLKEIIANLDETTSNKPDEHIHLAIHNILLEGMVHHTNLDEVFKKVEELANRFKTSTQSPAYKHFYDNMSPSFEAKQINIQTGHPYSINAHIGQFNSNVDLKNDDVLTKLIKFNKLKDELSGRFGVLSKNQPNSEKSVMISEANANSDELSKVSYDLFGNYAKNNEDFKMRMNKDSNTGSFDANVDENEERIQHSGPKLLIKASINVSPLGRDLLGLIKDPNEIRGLVEMTYKGKPIKFQQNNDNIQDIAKVTTNEEETKNENEYILKRILEALNLPQNTKSLVSFNTNTPQILTGGNYKVINKRDVTANNIQNDDSDINDMKNINWNVIGIDTTKEESGKENEEGSVENFKDEPSSYLYETLLKELIKMYEPADNSKAISVSKIISKRSIESGENINNERLKTKSRKQKVFHRPVIKKANNNNKLLLKIITHFKENGIGTEEKNKMIQSLMKKIEKVIHSQEFVPKTKVSTATKMDLLNIQKRIQSPIDFPTSTLSPAFHRTMYKNITVSHKIYDPSIISTLETRKTDPIDKIIISRVDPEIPRDLNSPDSSIYEPKEVEEIQEAFASDNNIKMIAHRIQRPIDLKESDEKNNGVFKIGSDTMIIRNLDDAGIAIGYNQNIDESFLEKNVTELQNMLREYEESVGSNIGNNEQEYDDFMDYSETSDTRTIEELRQKKYGYLTERKVFKRSIDSGKMKAEDKFDKGITNNYNVVQICAKLADVGVFDEHFNKDNVCNEYLAFMEHNYPLGYSEYKEIVNGIKVKTDKSDIIPISETYIEETNQSMDLSDNVVSTKTKQIATILDDDFINKNLKPADILTLSNLLDRTKRQSNHWSYLQHERSKRQIIRRVYRNIHKNKNRKVKKNKKLIRRIKKRISRYLAKELNKNRHKRQAIKKLSVQVQPRHQSGKPKFSDEDLLFSDERSIQDELDRSHGGIHIYAPNHKENFLQRYMSIKLPGLQNPDNNIVFKNIFENVRHKNQEELMMNYPHIFQEKTEQQDLNASEQQSNYTIKNHEKDVSDEFGMDNTQHINPLQQEMLGNDQDNTKYKVTVKVFPKNVSDITSGFKVAHTSINKTINKGGKIYITQYNVSQITHIEDPNEKRNKQKLKEEMPIDVIASKYRGHLIQHKTKLEDQLQKLLSQKETVDNLLFPPVSSNDLIEVTLPFGAPKVIKLSRESVNSLVTSALCNLQLADKGIQNQNDCPITTDTTTEKTIIVTTTTPKLITTEKITTTPKYEPIPDTESNKKEQRNDNEIISRIDKNTKTLEQLLEVLKQSIFDNRKPYRDYNTDDMKPYKNMQSNYKAQEPPLAKSMSPISPVDDNMGIPFNINNSKEKDVLVNHTGKYLMPVYYIAQPNYVSPFKVQDNTNAMTNIIYHGHIHASKIIPNKEKIGENSNSAYLEINKNANDTKYFIDEPVTTDNESAKANLPESGKIKENKNMDSSISNKTRINR